MANKGLRRNALCVNCGGDDRLVEQNLSPSDARKKLAQETGGSGCNFFLIAQSEVEQRFGNGAESEDEEMQRHEDECNESER